MKDFEQREGERRKRRRNCGEQEEHVQKYDDMEENYLHNIQVEHGQRRAEGDYSTWHEKGESLVGT